MQSHNIDRAEVPEDVLAEMDLEERRRLLSTSPVVPEDVLSEQDRQARLAEEARRAQLAEGTPPALTADDEATPV